MKKQTKKHRIAILASGSGSNAGKFISYFRDHQTISVVLVVSNNASAFVLQRAANAGVPSVVLPRQAWEEKKKVLALFDSYQVNTIVLAGYMRLLPPWMTERYSGRIFNIHPALLPDFGGKGMYGMHVHRAVIESGVRRSGITVHLVNERYDEGPILFQKQIDVLPGDTPETLSKKIKQLEHENYPRVVEEYLGALPLIRQY